MSSRSALMMKYSVNADDDGTAQTRKVQRIPLSHLRVAQETSLFLMRLPPDL